MSDKYYCEKCGGLTHGKGNMDEKYCFCEQPGCYSEQERDEFAATFLRWFRNNAIPSQTGHLSSEQILEQFKDYLKQKGHE